MLTARWTFGLLSAVGAACTASAPFAPLPVAITVTHEGAPPSAAAAALSPDSGAAVENDSTSGYRTVVVTVLALRRAPAIEAVEPQLAAIAATKGRAFGAAFAVPPGTGWADPAPEPAAGHSVGEAAGVVGPALRARFAPARPELPAIACAPVEDGVAVTLCSADGRCALLRRPVRPGVAAQLFVPFAEGGAVAGLAGHAVRIEVGAAAPAAAVAAARAEAAAAAAQPALASPLEHRWQLATGAIGVYARRAALLSLAATYDLPAATDLLLAADERLLIAVGDSLAGRGEAPVDAWTFQRTLWEALVPGLLRDELAPGLRAAAIRGLGALASEPATLRLHLHQSADAVAFADALRSENVYALQDRDAIHRVRAHDWLGAHGVEVPGYDPLADEAAREQALDAWQDPEALP